MANVFDTVFKIVIKMTGSKESEQFFDKFAGSAFKGTLAANLATKAFGFAVEKTKELIDHGLKVNEIYEDLEDRFTGLILTTTNFGKVKDPFEQFKLSARGAQAMVAEFERTAIKVGTPLQDIANLSAAIEPIWTSFGKSQKDVADATDAAASAAKVLGINTNQIEGSMIRILHTGKAGRNDTIGRLLISKAEIKAGDTKQKQAEKLFKALKSIGGPVDQLAKGTGEAMQRWQTLSDSILRRVTKPIFDKIGESIQGIVDWTLKHENAIDKAVQVAHDLFDVVFSISDGFLKGAAAIGDWWLNLGMVKGTLGAIADLGSGFFRTVELVGHAWKVVAEGLDVMADPSRGLGKLDTLVDGLYVKLLKVIQAFADMMGKIAGIVLPDSVKEMMPDSVKDFFNDVKDTYKVFDQYVAGKEKSVARREEALGMSPTTDIGKAAESARMSRDQQRSFLDTLKGQGRPLFQQNIDKIEIRQDFRDQDPDRILVEFTKDLERLGETAYQSTVGGAGSAFGPGSV